MYLWMELAKAADVLIKQLLCARSGENLLLYADTSTDPDIVNAVAAAGYTAGVIPTIIWYETRPEVDMEPPKPVAAAMKNADVICEFAKMYIIHTNAYYEALKAGARHLCLTGITKEMMIRCIGRVDYPLIVELGDRLTELTCKASEVKITSPGGTNITFKNDPERPIIHHRGVIKKAGERAMLGGQISWAPIEETINGAIVFDGSLWPPDEIGLLKSPIKLVIKNGRVVEVRGEAEARILESWLSSFEHPSMYNLAHVSYGFNPGARLTGNILEDERIFGCIEWGIGSQTDYFMGRAGRAPSHTDGIILNPSIQLDREPIEEEGKYVHPMLVEISQKLKGR
ncbi:MAG: Thermophilic metalloprotease (M29) [Candidatus Bathyarchaeota archaeon BA1]|nr:MAG: Thermophilic metalloprotease (M29) [Candidatus Bathyarchaeota archaeon BA1]